jgi:membrane-associated phospholipid phosphatase
MALLTERPVAAQQGGPANWVRTATSALPLFVTALVGVGLTAFVALYTAWGQHYDERARNLLFGGDGPVNTGLVHGLEEVTTGSAAVALAIMLAVAVVRRRFRVGVAAVALVIGANLTTQLLKHRLLDRPDLGDGATNSLPSGHTTVVFSLVLAGVLVSPRALRWLVALLGSAVGGLIGMATVIAGWHRPSDVVAGFLVTLAWAALVSAFAGRPRDGRWGGGGMFPALLGGALAALGVVIYGYGWTDDGSASKVIPIASAVIAGVAALAVGAYAQLVSRTSN